MPTESFSREFKVTDENVINKLKIELFPTKMPIGDIMLNNKKLVVPHDITPYESTHLSIMLFTASSQNMYGSEFDYDEYIEKYGLERLFIEIGK